MTAICTAIQPNVDLVELDGRKFYLVGTAHVSPASVELAESVIKEIRPDAVAVELCESRFQALRDPNRWKNTDIVQVIKSGRTLLLLAQLILAAFQKKLGKSLNIKPGEEMLRAVAVAEESQIPIILADRDVKTTLRRTWNALSGSQKAQLVVQFPMKTFSGETVDPSEIENLKKQDALESAMAELGASFPGIRTALIDERDKYLAGKIHDSVGQTVVAIIGAGHVPGIKQYLGQKIDLLALDQVPPKRKTGRIIAWTLSAIVLFFVLYGFASMGEHTGLAMAKSWILITGLSAALGALLALSHPLTVLTAFVCGPIITLFPIMRPGWFAGMVEAMLRKPKVSDLESILDDMTSIKGLWRNRLSRILLVVIFTNILGAIGSIIAIGKVASLSNLIP